MTPQRRLKLTIAYDGMDYHGWQIQPGLKTVQGTLCSAAAALLRQKVHIQGASRTDAGVHAQGQVGVLDTISTIPTDQFASALNEHLPHDIRILQTQTASPDFDAVRDVKRKHYRYTVWASRVHTPRARRFCWHFPGTLDADIMHTAAQHLLGTHDFRSFAVSVRARQNTIRSLSRCDVNRGQGSDQDMIRVDIEGRGFLRHMVRIIVGTLVDISRGNWRPEQIVDILDARSRLAAGHRAPAGGLCLEGIQYGEAE